MERAATSAPVYWLVRLTAVLVILSAGALVLLEERAHRAGAHAFMFLPWNLFLAWVPFVLALGAAAVHARRGPRLLLWALAIGWLLFLPNAPYILTDFVHLGRRGGVPLWFDAALIGAFAATGLLLGLASLLIVHHIVEERAGRIQGWLVAIGSLVLSAAGIYLGRFPRFNSWDVLTNPGALADVVLNRLADPLGNPFLLRFAVLLSLILVSAYVVAWMFGRGLVAPAGARLGARPRLRVQH